MIVSGIVQTDSKPNYNFSTLAMNRKRNNNGPGAEFCGTPAIIYYWWPYRFAFFSCGPDNSIKFTGLLFGFKFDA